MYITSSGDIRYDNWSYAVVVQRKSCASFMSTVCTVWEIWSHRITNEYVPKPTHGLAVPNLWGCHFNTSLHYLLWVSSHFLRQCHLATFKTFYAKPTQKRYGYSSRDLEHLTVSIIGTCAHVIQTNEYNQR